MLAGPHSGPAECAERLSQAVRIEDSDSKKRISTIRADSLSDDMICVIRCQENVRWHYVRHFRQSLLGDTCLDRIEDLFRCRRGSGKRMRAKSLVYIFLDKEEYMMNKYRLSDEDGRTNGRRTDDGRRTTVDGRTTDDEDGRRRTTTDDDGRQTKMDLFICFSY